jgi:hypothetical protein
VKKMMVHFSGVCSACQVHVTLKARPTVTMEVCQQRKVQLYHHTSVSLTRNMLVKHHYTTSTYLAPPCAHKTAVAALGHCPVCHTALDPLPASWGTWLPAASESNAVSRLFTFVLTSLPSNWVPCAADAALSSF